MTQNLTAAKIRAQSAFNSTPLEDQLRPEIWRRKQIAAVTFGIEVRGLSLMTEYDWDRAAQHITPQMGTCHPLLDEFFVMRFSPMTTGWIHDHPELDRVAATFDRYLTIMRSAFDFNRPEYQDKMKHKT